MGSCHCLAEVIWTKPTVANKREFRIRSVGGEDNTCLLHPKDRASGFFHGRAPKTDVGGTDNGDADVKLDTAKGRRTKAPPFFTEKLTTDDNDEPKQ